MAHTRKAHSALRDLKRELARRIEGEVRFDDASRAVYSTDSSNYRQIPVGVVIPRHEEDVVKTLAACRRFGIPILPRGAGTSLAGQACNAAVVIDMSKHMNRILELNPEEGWARVQAGVVLDDLRAEAQRHGLTFGPDPATHSRCTIGGMIGNNSCGAHSIMAGKTVDNVEALEVLTYDGQRLAAGRTGAARIREKVAAGGREAEIYSRLLLLAGLHAALIRGRYPKIRRRVSGYNLDELLPEKGFHVARALVGSEGTCVTVLNARLRLIPNPGFRVLAVLGFADIYAAADRTLEIMGYHPIALEGLDQRLVLNQKTNDAGEAFPSLPPDGGWLLVEFGGRTHEEALGRARRLEAGIKDRSSILQFRILEKTGDQKKIWEVRESGVGATVFVPGQKDAWPGWEDSAVPPEKTGAYLRDLRRLLDANDYHGAFYGHFGDGCIHARIDFDLVTGAGIRRFRSFMEEAAGLVVRYGGSLSGEHGDGQARAELLPAMFGPELVQAFATFKEIWDPAGKMNPGKIVRPYRMDENLRHPPDYPRLRSESLFDYPGAGRDFARAVRRCAGTGKCLGTGSGTMCPSYMATREEKYSTRGRSRLLFEMLMGETVKGGWRDGQVREALELCLSCKACKSECPTNVDMAAYKAEFMAHYYERRPRPPLAYLSAWIEPLARWGSRSPALANFFTQAPLSSGLIKFAAGISPHRRLPRLARETFRRWFEKRGAVNPGLPRVILWPDVFHDYFLPETAQAAVRVLEWAGHQVLLPKEGLSDCRPLFDYGMLKTARRRLGEVMRALAPWVEAGVPVIFLEPSSFSVFRDELVRLFPDDPQAAKLCRQAFFITEFLAARGPAVFPRLDASAVVHGHCHQKAVLGMEADLKLLAAMRVSFQVLDAGCCGMAGSFGFRKDRYRLSVDIAESRLLPAIRRTADQTRIVANGFSCREQIAQLTGRKAVHIIEVVDEAVRRQARA